VGVLCDTGTGTLSITSRNVSSTLASSKRAPRFYITDLTPVFVIDLTGAQSQRALYLSVPNFALISTLSLAIFSKSWRQKSCDDRREDSANHLPT
jgi:hypothetical protein